LLCLKISTFEGAFVEFIFIRVIPKCLIVTIRAETSELCLVLVLLIAFFFESLFSCIHLVFVID
jgi:hypothetical protein